MKKFLSLILVAAMLVAVLAMVGCNKEPVESTDTTTAATTTEAAKTTEATTVAPTTEATTVAPTTEATTTVAPTTTATTTVAPTTTATTAAPTTETTVAPAGTTGETLPVFARFDFGTKTKAEAEGLTSHEYLTSILTYDKSYVQVEFTEDTIVIYATKNYTSGLDSAAFALCFEDIVTYDFDGELDPGYGSWDGAPVSSKYVGQDDRWRGVHQFMKVRILNDTPNNMISMHYHRPGEGYATTLLNTCMYLQGGAPTEDDIAKKDHKLTTTPTKEWKTYTYDMVFLAGLGREMAMSSDKPTSYVDAIVKVKAKNWNFQNNWNQGGRGTISGLRFHFLGALGQAQEFMSDSRLNIKMGNRVEVDYVVFGSSVDQLKGYTSYMEDKAA